MNALFRWIHISDVHAGHGDATYGLDQRLVLDELKRDVLRQIKAQPAPSIDAILVTGDIASTGGGSRPDEYEVAASWLAQVGKAAGVSPDRIFIVPGNHDVDRSADGNADVKRLVTELRDGTKNLDAALADTKDRALLARRMDKYLTFARAFAPAGADDRLLWVHRFVARSGLPVRLVGLNTALLAAGDDDRGKLRLGLTQIERTLQGVQEDELVLALAHHPLRGGWLADEADIEPYLKRHVHALLTGHVHEADAEESRGGAGGSFLRIVAGSAYGDRMHPGIPAGHGYSFGAVMRGDHGQGSIRLMPRKWSAKNASFRPDMDNVPDDRTFSEHLLPASLPLRIASRSAAGSTVPVIAKPLAVNVVRDELVPVFISAAREDARLREELQKHLVSLRRQNKAVFVHSQEAPAGGDRARWIASRINEARIILLLISTDYLAADEYYEDELLRAVERHDRGEARVIPILLRTYLISGEPFAKLQALPRDGHPVDRHPAGQDAALAGIAQEVIKLVALMRGEQPARLR